MVKGLKNAYLVHFSSLLFWFHCRVCNYLKCSSSLSQSLWWGQTKGKKTFLGQNLFHALYIILIVAQLYAFCYCYLDFWVDHYVPDSRDTSHRYQYLSILSAPTGRGVRYIDEKLSKADKSEFLKLSATYLYRKIRKLKLSKNYRYRKKHQIWFYKYMKIQSIRN